MFLHSVNILWWLLCAGHCCSKIASPCRIGKDGVKPLARGPASGQEQDMTAAVSDWPLPVLEPDRLRRRGLCPCGCTVLERRQAHGQTTAAQGPGFSVPEGHRVLRGTEGLPKPAEGRGSIRESVLEGVAPWISQAEHASLFLPSAAFVACKK